MAPLVCSTSPPGLTSTIQVEAISHTVMAQVLGMFAAFQAQLSDLMALVSESSSMPRPPATSTVTSVIMVRLRPQLESSSVETEVSMVRPQLTCAEVEDKVTPVREYLSSSSPELATRGLFPVTTVSIAPQGTVDDSRRTVVYDSGHTDPIMVRVNTEGSSEAMLSFPSVSDRSHKWKKDKKWKKRYRRHSSVSSPPGGKLAKHHQARKGGGGKSPFILCY